MVDVKQGKLKVYDIFSSFIEYWIKNHYQRILMQSFCHFFPVCLIQAISLLIMRLFYHFLNSLYLEVLGRSLQCVQSHSLLKPAVVDYYERIFQGAS